MRLLLGSDEDVIIKMLKSKFGRKEDKAVTMLLVFLFYFDCFFCNCIIPKIKKKIEEKW